MNDEQNRADQREVTDHRSESTASDSAAQRVDWEVALDTTGGDDQLLVEVLEAFQIETPQMVTAMREALESGDAVTLRRAAHTVKNACYNLGDQVSGDLAFELERLARDGQLDDVPTRFDRLETFLRQMQAEVNQYLRQHDRQGSRGE
jgi:HPt (histidine-containing phosphotransfer) domain-containing protein